MDRAAANVDGQNISSIFVEPLSGESRFEFDLGGLIETWPYGDDPTEEQWYIYGPEEVFAYRADGLYCKQPGDTPCENEIWCEIH